MKNLSQKLIKALEVTAGCTEPAALLSVPVLSENIC